MADIVASQRTHITSGTLGDKTARSCAGVPGAGSLDAAYVYVNTYINTLLDSDGLLWFANTSGYVRQTGMIDEIGDTYWFSTCMIRRNSFTLNYGGDSGNLISRYGSELFQRELWKSMGIEPTFTGNTTYSVTTSPATTDAAESAGYYCPGWTLDDCNPTTSNGVSTIELSLAYPIYYSYSSTGSTSRDGDTAVSFSSVSFEFEVTNLIEYYPFAIYSSSAWQSCNRSGGALEKYSGSAWTDLKNIEGSSDDSSVFNYDGSSWNIAPLIGNS